MQDTYKDFEQFLTEFRNFREKKFKNIKEVMLSKKMKMCILSNLMEHIYNEKSFALYDEKSFEIYQNILKNYKIFLQKYSNIETTLNEEIQKNLVGIRVVLKSQVSFFDEKDDFGINPISAEKKKIITDCLDKIYSDINELTISFEKFDEDDDFIKYLKDSLTKIYKKNIRLCFSNINDNENRRIMSYYNDILEEEREVLSSIIKVQIKALEDLCQNNEEREEIGILLAPIIEIYQFSNKEFDEYTENVKSINPNIEIDIEKDMEDIFLNLNIETDEFKAKIEEIILKELTFKCSFKLDEISDLKKEIESTENIFEYIKNKFEEISIFIKNNLKEYNKTEFKEIINGIFESINIKVENLGQGKIEFLEEIEDLGLNLESNLNIDLSLFSYDLDEAFSYATKCDFENFQKYIEKNIFEKSFLKYAKLIEKANKTIYNFKKNSILFEIITFEEILNYSVIKLRKSKEKSIEKMIFEIDKITMEIQEILLANNIYIIKPKPHTMFNAKEHEVLLAEKNSEFKRGEIIKVITCGYKNFDKVLIRANVIAGK